MRDITRNKEDYLKTIYELGGKNMIIANKLIANSLNVSPPSVSEMISKLLKDGYVNYTSYRGVKLTALGIEKAMKVRRKHLLWEVFLVEKLGYDWEDVHLEAEILEHVTSIRLEKALDKYLNYPKFCPHGSPIVTREEDSVDYTSLDRIGGNKIYRISKVDDRVEIIRYIKNVNLNLGDKIQFLSKDMETGILVISKDGKEIRLELDIAKHIYLS